VGAALSTTGRVRMGMCEGFNFQRLDTNPRDARCCRVIANRLYPRSADSIGLGFFVYGKRQRAVVPLVCGLALMTFPYFVSNTVLMVLVGVVLIAIPYFFRI